MFGWEEKGKERKGWREKREEKEEVCVWYGEKNGGKGKVEEKNGVWDPPFSFLPLLGGNRRERKGQVFG